MLLQDDDIIITLFLAICEKLGNHDTKHSQGKLYLSEIILCGVIFTLKGGSFRRFYRWFNRRRLLDLPDRTRLQRLLITHHQTCNEFLDTPTFFNAMDSFGVEIIHPMREGRSTQSQSVAGKGKSNHRWIVGRKINISLNGKLKITNWQDETANICDNQFDNEYQNCDGIFLTDNGYRKRSGTPANFKICKRGTWPERMVVETLFSLWTRICRMKQSFHRTIIGFKAKVAYLTTLTNLIVELNRQYGFKELSMVEWAL